MLYLALYVNQQKHTSVLSEFHIKETMLVSFATGI